MKAKLLFAVFVMTGLLITAGKSYGCFKVPPTADIVAVPQYVIVGRSVTLDGSGSYDPYGGYITRYQWDFTNDGSYDYYETSSYYPDGAFDGKTTHTYDSNDTYTVKLRVKDNGGPYGYGYDTDTCTVYVSLDSDNDDLPDDWEDLYGLDSNDFNDADTDLDSDGFNNLCEYLHGTDPNDPNSEPNNTSYAITISVPADVNSGSRIQRAINAAINGDTIVVSKGTYYENVDFNDTEITLRSTDPNGPNVVAATIIDANGSGNVVTFDAGDANSVLKGFTITGGERGIYCNGVSPTISNCIITGNGDGSDDGGGIYDCNSSLIVTNCVLSGNRANYGGGIYNLDSSPTITNCVFSQNIGVFDGGGMYNYDSSPSIVNCTFNGNKALIFDGAGMYNYGASSQPNVVNCIFWGDENVFGSPVDEIYNNSADPNFSYCDIEGCGGSSNWDPNFGSDDGNNIDADPNFWKANNPAGPDNIWGTSDDGLHLRTNSGCIDAANGNSAPSTDMTGWLRIDVSYVSNTGGGDPNYVDIGAYESITIWFVDDDANGNNDGSSWDNAFIDLQSALNEAEDCNDEIWVAAGIYEPNDGNDRSVSFELVENVEVYGGFSGWEVHRDQRSWTLYETILSGDINSIGEPNDNSYHVVIGADNAVLDGFTIRYGYAWGSDANSNGAGMYNYQASPIVTNCIFSDNSALLLGGGMYDYNCSPILTDCTFNDNDANDGGGMYCYQNSPTISRCTFSENYAESKGGGLYCDSSDPTITNCIFSENETEKDGGSIYDFNSSPIVTNCTFSGNYAYNDGGGMYNYGASSEPVVTNCVFWGNDAVNDGNEIYNSTDPNADPNFSYCDIKGCGGSDSWDPNFGNDDGNNIDSDPLFVDESDNDYHLRVNSPCINVGDPNGDYEDQTDIDGDLRIMNGQVDIGFDETHSVLYVDCNVQGGNDDGTSWANAYDDLQEALNAATSGNEIWVALGIYKPTDGNDQMISFNLVENVGVYGGFSETETARSQRDWVDNETILSGDINTQDDQNDNSFTVVESIVSGAIIDGFTITKGNHPGYAGGGLDFTKSSTVSNCIIKDNVGKHTGGMSAQGSAVVTNCVFSGNFGGYPFYSSGGLYVTGGAVVTIVDSVFFNNTGSYGGGLGIDSDGEVTIMNSIFSENDTLDAVPVGIGGAIYVSQGSNGSVRLINSTFYQNGADWGGAIYNNNSKVDVRNCILWSNIDEISNNGTGYSTTLSYCDIEDCNGSGPSWNSSLGTDGGGNLDSDPCFVDANTPTGSDGVFWTLDDGLMLKSNSPCIDAGDGDSAPLKDTLSFWRVDIYDVNNTGTGSPDYADIGAHESYGDFYDYDGDAMADDWEIFYGLDPFDPEDANDDEDDDGYSNVTEYLFDYNMAEDTNEPIQMGYYPTEDHNGLLTMGFSMPGLTQIDPTKEETVTLEYYYNVDANVVTSFINTDDANKSVTISHAATAGLLNQTVWNGKDANDMIVERYFYDVNIAAVDGNSNSYNWSSSDGGDSSPSAPTYPADYDVNTNDFNPYQNTPVTIDCNVDDWSTRKIDVVKDNQQDSDIYHIIQDRLIQPGWNNFDWYGRWNVDPNTGQLCKEDFDVYFDIVNSTTGVNKGAVLVYYEKLLEDLRCNPYRILPLSEEVVKITYYLPCNAYVTIDIYDPDGVHFGKILDNELQYGGWQEVIWHGTDGEPNDPDSRYISEEGIYRIEVEIQNYNVNEIIEGSIAVYK